MVRATNGTYKKFLLPRILDRNCPTAALLDEIFPMCRQERNSVETRLSYR